MHGSHTNRSEARLASLRYFQTVHCLLLDVPRRAERDQFALWSFRIPPFPHRRSRASMDSSYTITPRNDRNDLLLVVGCLWEQDMIVPICVLNTEHQPK